MQQNELEVEGRGAGIPGGWAETVHVNDGVSSVCVTPMQLSSPQSADTLPTMQEQFVPQEATRFSQSAATTGARSANKTVRGSSEQERQSSGSAGRTVRG